MCGIAGIVRLETRGASVDHDELDRLGRSLAHRGPDGAGAWIAADRAIGLAHRRLAVIDPGPGGAQPMEAADGRLRLVFNGEIYNHRALRAELEAKGHRFRGRSDTEVLLELYRRDGAAMVERLSGMYAFALWDAERGGLLLARDPWGIKPLYYARAGGRLTFASQVSSLGAPGGLDAAGVVGFLCFGSVPEPFTLDRAIRALPA
ncbi:MAG: asparagine synthetase B, partial [Alphaproteobacteria bacterium]|nr:asparagine synthetase B [Alphaproteobacteria bacterium]